MRYNGRWLIGVGAPFNVTQMSFDLILGKICMTPYTDYFRRSVSVCSSIWAELCESSRKKRRIADMATNSKSVQKRADEKRAAKRARAWTAIVYPESAAENWQQVLRDLLIECLISPLHDKDILPTGEEKKAHYHVVLSFKNPTSYDKACEVFEEIGAVVPPAKECRVKDFRQMARYLCHLDQPDKHRYSMADVVSIGSIDYATLCMSAADEDDMLEEIFDAMDCYYLDSYPAVVRFTKEKHPEWKPIVFRKYTRQISEYAKGLHYEALRDQ